ncbi:MAG: hypothetical protein ACLSE7_01550 [Lachnospirales bacterium]
MVVIHKFVFFTKSEDPIGCKHNSNSFFSFEYNKSYAVVAALQVPIPPKFSAQAKGGQGGGIKNGETFAWNKSGNVPLIFKAGQIISGLDPDAAARAGGAVTVDDFQNGVPDHLAVIDLKGQTADCSIHGWMTKLQIDFPQVSHAVTSLGVSKNIIS